MQENRQRILERLGVRRVHTTELEELEIRMTRGQPQHLSNV